MYLNFQYDLRNSVQPTLVWTTTKLGCSNILTTSLNKVIIVPSLKKSLIYTYKFSEYTSFPIISFFISQSHTHRPEGYSSSPQFCKILNISFFSHCFYVFSFMNHQFILARQASQIYYAPSVLDPQSKIYTVIKFKSRPIDESIIVQNDIEDAFQEDRSNG